MLLINFALETKGHEGEMWVLKDKNWAEKIREIERIKKQYIVLLIYFRNLNLCKILCLRESNNDKQKCRKTKAKRRSYNIVS